MFVFSEAQKSVFCSGDLARPPERSRSRHYGGKGGQRTASTTSAAAPATVHKGDRQRFLHTLNSKRSRVSSVPSGTASKNAGTRLCRLECTLYHRQRQKCARKNWTRRFSLCLVIILGYGKTVRSSLEVPRKHFDSGVILLKRGEDGMPGRLPLHFEENTRKLETQPTFTMANELTSPQVRTRLPQSVYSRFLGAGKPHRGTYNPSAVQQQPMPTDRVPSVSIKSFVLDSSGSGASASRLPSATPLPERKSDDVENTLLWNLEADTAGWFVIEDLKVDRVHLSASVKQGRHVSLPLRISSSERVKVYLRSTVEYDKVVASLGGAMGVLKAQQAGLSKQSATNERRKANASRTVETPHFQAPIVEQNGAYDEEQTPFPNGNPQQREKEPEDAQVFVGRGQVSHLQEQFFSSHMLPTNHVRQTYPGVLFLHSADRSLPLQRGGALHDRRLEELQMVSTDEEILRPYTRFKRRQDLAARVTGIQRTIGASSPPPAVHRARGAPSVQPSARRHAPVSLDHLTSGRQSPATQGNPQSKLHAPRGGARPAELLSSVARSPDAFEDANTFFPFRSAYAAETLSPLWDGWEESVGRMVAEAKSLDWHVSHRMLQAVRLQVGAALGSDLAGSRVEKTDILTTRSSVGTSPRSTNRRADARGRRLRNFEDDASASASGIMGKTSPFQMLHGYMETEVATESNRNADEATLQLRMAAEKSVHEKDDPGNTSLVNETMARPSTSHPSVPSHVDANNTARRDSLKPAHFYILKAEEQKGNIDVEENISGERQAENSVPPLLKVVERPLDETGYQHQMVVINIDALGRRLDADSGRPLFYNDRVLIGWRCSASDLHALRATDVAQESPVIKDEAPKVPESKVETLRSAPPLLCSRPDENGESVCGHVPPYLGLAMPGVMRQKKPNTTANSFTGDVKERHFSVESISNGPSLSSAAAHSQTGTSRRRLQVLSHMVERFAPEGMDSVVPLFRRKQAVPSLRPGEERPALKTMGDRRFERFVLQEQEKSASAHEGHQNTKEETFTRMTLSSLSPASEPETVHTATSHSPRTSLKTSFETDGVRIKATAYESDKIAYQTREHHSDRIEKYNQTVRTLLDVDELCGLDLIKLSINRRRRREKASTAGGHEPFVNDDLEELKIFVDQFASQDYVDDILFIAPDAPIRASTPLISDTRKSHDEGGPPQSTMPDATSSTTATRAPISTEQVGCRLDSEKLGDVQRNSAILCQTFKEDGCGKLTHSRSKEEFDSLAAGSNTRALQGVNAANEIDSVELPNDPLFAVQWALTPSRRQRGMDSNVCFATARDEMLRYGTTTPTIADFPATPAPQVHQHASTESQLAKIRHLCEYLGPRILREHEAATLSQKKPRGELPTYPVAQNCAEGLGHVKVNVPLPPKRHEADFAHHIRDGTKVKRMMQKRDRGGGRIGRQEGEDNSSINMLQAWSLKLKGDKQESPATVPVAVIDTGVNYLHPDLADSMWINEEELNGIPGYDDDQNGYVDDVYGWNFLHGNNNPMDDNGHGTHVAGIIGAQRNNHRGVSGISSHARIIALKILDENGEGDVSHAIPAIRYALDNGARVITNSWGGITGPGTHILGVLLREAVSDANGSVFVIASGNDGKDITKEPYYPASFLRDWTITVAAHTPEGILPRWSNYGQHNVHITAPGENITSTWLGSGYRLSSGTSMAAPMVSGVAAEMLAHNRHLQPQQVVDALIQSSTPDIRQKSASLTGARLNAFRAIILSQMHFFSLSRSELHVDGATNSVGNVGVRIDAGMLPPGTYHGSLELIYVRKLGSKHSSVLTSVFKRRIVQLVQISLPVTMKIV